MFTLDLNGVLKSASLFNYGSGADLSIRVQVRDENNATLERDFKVVVTPKLIQLSSNQFMENMPVGHAIGNFSSWKRTLSSNDQISPSYPVGSKLWQINTGGWAISSPAMSDDGMVFMASKSRKVYAIDPSDGSIVWQISTSRALRLIFLS